MSSLLNFRSSAQKSLRVIASIGKLLVVGHCVMEYGGDIVICSGPSMEPSLRSNDILLTEHLSPVFGWLNRGDIIVTRSPSNPGQFICKRILGLPGDEILKSDGGYEHIPKGHVWLEGDNEHNSKDSRSYGPVPLGLVRGRAVLRIWPLLNMKYLIENDESQTQQQPRIANYE